jgi:osmotically inducible lipoprotein OsmB
MMVERRRQMRKLARLASVAVLALGVTACAGLDDRSGERTLTGAAIGAGVGAGAGLLTGGFIGKTVTGAAAGAAGGLIYDQIKKNEDD